MSDLSATKAFIKPVLSNGSVSDVKSTNDCGNNAKTNDNPPVK